MCYSKIVSDSEVRSRKKISNDNLLCYLETDDLKSRFGKYRVLINTTKENVEKIECLIPKECIIFLADKKGCVLYYNSYKENIYDELGIHLKVGAILDEEILDEEIFAVNALDLVVKHEQKISLTPGYHNPNTSKDVYYLGNPIVIENKTKGYLGFLSKGRKINKELIGFAILLVQNIEKDIINNYHELGNITVLGEQRKMILELLAEGLTEEAVALEMEISINTIKYHKRIILNELESQSIAQATAKATKMGLI